MTKDGNHWGKGNTKSNRAKEQRWKGTWQQRATELKRNKMKENGIDFHSMNCPFFSYDWETN